MITIEEIKKESMKHTVNELQKVRALLNTFEKDLSNEEIGLPENAAIAIKTMFLFCESEHGFATWFTNIRDAIVNQVNENKNKTRH